MASCRNKFSATVHTSCKLSAPLRVFGQLPGLRRFDERIRAVRQFHDQSHGPAVVPFFVRGRDLIAGLRRLLKQTTIVRIRRPTDPWHARTSHNGWPG